MRVMIIFIFLFLRIIEAYVFVCFPPHISGTPFWSGPKRPPTPLKFNSENATHLNFIIATANLLAHNFKIEGCSDKDAVRQLVDKVHVPEFSPKKVPFFLRQTHIHTHSSLHLDETIAVVELEEKQYILYVGGLTDL